MNKIIILSILFLSLISCETDKNKIDKSEKTVTSFISNLQFDNYDLMYKSYPTFSGVKTYWKIKDFKITNTDINEKTIVVYGKSLNHEILFEVEKINGDYQIIKSKGLSSDFNSYLYKFCKKIGCIGTGNYDIEISKICNDNRYIFNDLVSEIKKNIENNVNMENHTVTKSYGMATGDVTIKNYSRFTIPKFSYKVYVQYSDSKGKILFKSEETLAYSTIPFEQSITFYVSEMNSRSFKKIGIEFKITDTDFIKNIIADYAKGSNCNYSNNL